MPDFAVRTAFRATDRISPAFRQMGNAADRFGTRGSRAMGRVSRVANSVRNSIRSMLPVFGVAGLGLVAGRAIELASDLTEVQNVVDVTFGQSAAQINQWSNNAIRAFGLSELQAKQFTGSLGAMLQSSGVARDQLVRMSTGLSGLAGDFASFYNLPIQDAFEKIRAGISGEVEPLRRLGINMSVANLQAYALSQGINRQWRQMTQAEQVQLRYNYLMHVSRNAQGDFNRTLATSYANQKRVLGVQFDQFLARVATRILPTLVGLFQRLNRILAGIDTDFFARGLKMVVDLIPYLVGGFLAYKAVLIGISIWQGAMVAAGWIRYLVQMAPLIMRSVRAMGFFQTMLKGTAVWQGILAIKTGIATAAQWLMNTAFFACPITWIILGIVALIAAIVLLVRNWDTVKAKILMVWEAIKEKVQMVVGYLTGLFENFGDAGFMDVMIAPINMLISQLQLLFTIAARIPRIGQYFQRAADSIGEYQAAANQAMGTRNLFAPNQAQQGGQVRMQGEININNAPPGSTARVTRGAENFALELMGVNP